MKITEETKFATKNMIKTEMELHIDEDGCLVVHLNGEGLVTADERGLKK